MRRISQLLRPGAALTGILLIGMAFTTGANSASADARGTATATVASDCVDGKRLVTVTGNLDVNHETGSYDTAIAIKAINGQINGEYNLISPVEEVPAGTTAFTLEANLSPGQHELYVFANLADRDRFFVTVSPFPVVVGACESTSVTPTPNPTPNTDTITWNGKNGSEHAFPNCKPGQATEFHFILSGNGAKIADPGTGTATFSPSSSDSDEGGFNGASDNGAAHYYVSSKHNATVESFVISGVTWVGDKAPTIKLSHSGCVGDEVTPTPTLTVTPSVTPTPTPTVTPSVTPTPTPTVTPSVTPTATPTVTSTSTPTTTSTPTVTPTPTKTTVMPPKKSPKPASSVAPPPSRDKSDEPASVNLLPLGAGLALLLGTGLSFMNSRRVGNKH